MKQLFFETTKAFTQFIELCKKNSIKFTFPKGKAKLHMVEVPDTMETDEFLEKTGYN